MITIVKDTEITYDRVFFDWYIDEDTNEKLPLYVMGRCSFSHVVFESTEPIKLGSKVSFNSDKYEYVNVLVLKNHEENSCLYTGTPDYVIDRTHQHGL